MSETLTLHDGGARDVGEVMAVMDDAFRPSFGEAWTRSQNASLQDSPRDDETESVRSSRLEISDNGKHRRK